MGMNNKIFPPSYMYGYTNASSCKGSEVALASLYSNRQGRRAAEKLAKRAAKKRDRKGK